MAVSKKDVTRSKLIEALLDGMTITSAAEHAGVSRRTVYSYMREDKEFAQMYRQAQEAATLQQMERLSADQARARDVILSIMDDQESSPSIRLKAAQVILSIGKSTQERAEAIISNNATRSALDEYFESSF